MSDPPRSTRPAITAPTRDGSSESIPVDIASTIIERAVAPVAGEERLPLDAALDRVLARDLVSPIDVPAHDNAAMDGYAFRITDLAADGSTRLTIRGSAFAGRPFDGTVAPGHAVRVMTGAVIPAGLDSVVMQESVRGDGDTIEIDPAQHAGQHVRRRGEDLAVGGVAIAAGRLLTPSDVGLIASLGIAQVTVRRRPRVAFFTTGNELRAPGQPLAPGQIYDSNRHTLQAMLTRLGVQPLDLGTVADDPASLESVMRSAASSADAIISSGGVSVGEADFTRTVLAALGDVAFWSIAMRPGRPLAFGRIGEAHYFGLPGNPVATMIAFYVFVRPALRRLAGVTGSTPPVVQAIADGAFDKKPGRTEYQRGVLFTGEDGRTRVRSTGPQGSGVLSSLSRANCLVVLGHARPAVVPGDIVDCLPLDGLA